jgi:hypothetical protein
MTRLYACLPLLFALGCHKKVAEAAPPPVAAAPAALPVAAANAPSDGRHAKQTLEVVIDGKPAGNWSPEQIATLPRLSLTNKNGEARDGWSLRDAATKLVAPGARVVGLTGEDGDRLAIAPADWSNAKRTLVLKVSGRGSYKAHWVEANGESGDAIVKNVTKIELAK